MMRLVDSPAKPPLRVAESFGVVVDQGLSHARLLAHARRVAALAGAVAVEAAKDGRWAAREVHALGVALSQALDLGMAEPDVALRWCEAHLHPTGGVHAAFRADAPRYVPRLTDGMCPIPGPSGGRHPGTARGKVVVDRVTGDWVYAAFCNRHQAEVTAANEGAPEPSPNRGGVLANVFHEWDLSKAYERATGREVRDTMPGLVKLRVVEGGRA